jgi:hypothetical protein
MLGPDGRQALVTAIFARLDVLGFQWLEYELTPDAIDRGLDAALPPTAELESQIGEFSSFRAWSPAELRPLALARVSPAVSSMPRM